MSSNPFGPSFGDKPPVIQSNPYADVSANPYASPLGGHMPKPEYSGGVYRLGASKLVLHRQAALPPRCIKTGEPAETAIRKTLYWHHPALILLVFFPGILVYAIVALIVRKSMTFSFPVTYRARTKLRVCLAAGILCLIGSFAMLIGGVAMADNGGDGSFAAICGVAFLVLLVTSIVMFYLSRVVTPTKITDEFTVVKGISPEFLAGIPDWPQGSFVP
jgi:hypothetical protein